MTILRNYRLKDFEKLIDRQIKISQTYVYYNRPPDKLWFIDLNENLAEIFLLRLLPVTSIYFEIALENISSHNLGKNQQKHINFKLWSSRHLILHHVKQLQNSCIMATLVGIHQRAPPNCSVFYRDQHTPYLLYMATLVGIHHRAPPNCSVLHHVVQLQNSCITATLVGIHQRAPPNCSVFHHDQHFQASCITARLVGTYLLPLHCLASLAGSPTQLMVAPCPCVVRAGLFFVCLLVPKALPAPLCLARLAGS